ncbi:hypothetical protein BOTBODRAFT_620256 [Botryobasidium botryosum FD-172 SS1]|uniref:Uncharacterized protein n=1 Tax=Botryobasidium botryosum (strain FD-172 SS1) TaxID=930990 RepID=A0A067MNG5_BOTB1|nr:hypothetical protein BOTBODRAFT_620256 [Botryobasidium botryosum FD-172 SS1]
MPEINQRLDKLTAVRSHPSERGLLQGTALSDAINDLVGSIVDHSDDSEGGLDSTPEDGIMDSGDDDDNDNDGEPVDDCAAVGVELAPRRLPRKPSTLGTAIRFPARPSSHLGGASSG